MKKIESRIIEGKVNHQGKELDTYVPQINIGDGWIDVLDEKSYLLKEGYNPFKMCKKCYAEGMVEGKKCSECSGRGFVKSEPVDLKYHAQYFIDTAIKEIEQSQKTLTKYSPIKNNKNE